MAIGKDGAVIRQLRTLFNVGAIRELTDGQLLERFAAGRGEAAELAFAVMLERHGPMVLRVCQGVLADAHDTQDAFQATFLVLVEKARGLWVRDSLGPWLHQVAFRTASCARAAAARRTRHEQRAALAATERRGEARDELGLVLHAEIERLPERFRTPLVLCDLEGRTHEQAARHLGWPVGTVKSRLTRGRLRLRDQLQRRGLAPDSGLLAAVPATCGPQASLPAALIDSTTGAAIELVTTGTVVPGRAALLFQGVVKTMFLIKCLKVASVILVLGATASGVDLVAQKLTPDAAPRPDSKLPAARADEVPAFAVTPGKFRVTVVARGVVEASRSEAVFCKVEGSTTIIALVPEGTRVKQGQLIGELDSSALADSLKNQKSVTLEAQRAYREAQGTRKVSEVAVVEFTEAISKSEQEIKKLQAEVEKAKAAEQAKMQAWDLEKRKEADLESQIKSCKLLAPGDGLVVYANDPNNVFKPPVIVVGAKVRERQIIVHVRDVDGPMRANIKVPEAWVDQLAAEMAARIHVDAFPGEILTGKVESINPRPDTNLMFLGSADNKVYTTRVTIDKELPGLRPGMAAQAEILINELDNVLSVTQFAVLHFDGKDHVAVKKPDGGFDWREVTLGIANDRYVEVKQGLESGEVVIINPRRLMTAEEKRTKLGAPAPPAEKPGVPR